MTLHSGEVFHEEGESRERPLSVVARGALPGLVGEDLGELLGAPLGQEADDPARQTQRRDEGRPEGEDEVSPQQQGDDDDDQAQHTADDPEL